MSDSEIEPEKKVDWDPVLEPIIKLVLGKKGIKTKSASEVGKKKVEFFRGKDFVQFLIKHDKIVKRKCQKALDQFLDGDAPCTDKEVAKLGGKLLEKGFFVKSEYQPITQKESDKKNKKWPDRLVRLQGNRFDPDGFYIILYEGSQTWRYIMLVGVIIVVLCGCMFPAWPFWAKVGAWYFLVALLSLYFGLEMLRMSSFTTLWIVGCDFWIFPNLNDEYCGFFDSFRPVWSFEKRKDNFMMIAVRFMTLGIIGVAVEQISRTHSLSDVKDFVTNNYIDVIDWGKGYLENALPSSRMDIPSLEHLQKEEEEERKKEEEAAAAGTDAPEKQDEEKADDDDDVAEAVIDEDGEVITEEVD